MIKIKKVKYTGTVEWGEKAKQPTGLLFVLELRSQVVSEVPTRKLELEQGRCFVCQLYGNGGGEGRGLDNVVQVLCTKGQVDWLVHVNLDAFVWVVQVCVWFEDDATGPDLAFCLELNGLLGDNDLKRLTHRLEVPGNLGEVRRRHCYRTVVVHVVDRQHVRVDVHQLERELGDSVLLLVLENNQQRVWIVFRNQRQVVFIVTLLQDLAKRLQVETQHHVSVTSELLETARVHFQRNQKDSRVVDRLHGDTVILRTVEVTKLHRVSDRVDNLYEATAQCGVSLWLVSFVAKRVLGAKKS